MADIRKETDSLGEVNVPADKLWGAQTQRSLEHFSIGKDLIPREMITAYATLKKAAANANHAGKRLDDQRHKLIVQVCDEILAGQHQDMFPSARLDDRQRHAIQYERERSYLQPLLPARWHPAWQQISSTPERSRQYVAVVQRFVSLRNEHRRSCQCAAATDPGRQGAARCDRRKGPAVERRHQDRPHPHARRHATHARARVVRLRRHAQGRSRADRRCIEGRLPSRARRHCGGHRHQFRARFR